MPDWLVYIVRAFVWFVLGFTVGTWKSPVDSLSVVLALAAVCASLVAGRKIHA